jgi:quinol monooxygenase YgiN
MSDGREQGGLAAASREVCIITLIHARKHREDQVKEALLTVALAARSDEGCISYELHQDVHDSTTFILFENWRSKEDVDRHMATDRIRHFLSRVELMASPAMEPHVADRISIPTVTTFEASMGPKGLRPCPWWRSRCRGA